MAGLVGIDESEGQAVTDCLGRVRSLVDSDDFYCSYLESLSTEIVCQIVKVILSESAYDFRISVLPCKAFLLCLDEPACQCNH